MEPRSNGFEARFNTSSATSKSAWLYPSGCVHCFLVSPSHRSAISRLVEPSIVDLNGNAGVHHTSEDMPSPSGPIACTPEGHKLQNVQCWPFVYAERDSHSYLITIAERFAALAAQHGVITEDEAKVWLQELYDRAVDGTFFASLNYYFSFGNKKP